jgi:signal peptide peptidase SppA
MRSRIFQAFLDAVWAILPEKLDAIKAVIEDWETAGGDRPDIPADCIVEAREPYRVVAGPDGEIEALSVNQPQREQPRGQVAVLPLMGTIMHRANMMTDFSGGTSVQKFTAQFREAFADPNVGSILIDCDSPGGSVAGIEELAAEIFAARRRDEKTIVVSANALMASAAYWIGSAGHEVTATPSGFVGSIGVIARHSEHSEADKIAGITNTLLFAGKFKTAGNDTEPLSDDGRRLIQERVDAFYDSFVGAVSRHRGVSPATVRNGFGEGSVVGARDALAQKMIDRVEAFDVTLARLVQDGQRPARAGRGARADAYHTLMQSAPPSYSHAMSDVVAGVCVAAGDDPEICYHGLTAGNCPDCREQDRDEKAAADTDRRRRRARMLRHG